MSEGEVFLAFVALVGTFSLLGGIVYAVVSWLKGRHQRSEPREMSTLQQQIAQLQMSIDAMALEVERVSEAQRFVTKLLAERGEPARIARPSDR